MHAVYTSAMYFEEPEKLTKDVVAAEWDTCMERHLDENNWFTHDVAVTRDGLLIPISLQESGLQKSLNSMPREARWAWGTKFALQCVAIDMGAAVISGMSDTYIHSKKTSSAREWINAASPDEVIRAIEKNIPPEIARMMAELPPLAPENKGDIAEGDGSLFFLHQLRKLANEFMHFKSSGRGSLAGAGCIPFAVVGEYDVTPYSYRAFDLLEAQSKFSAEPNVLVFTDIHT